MRECDRTQAAKNGSSSSRITPLFTVLKIGFAISMTEMVRMAKLLNMT